MNNPHSAFHIPKSEGRWVALAALVVVLLSSLPYGVVALTTPAELRFGGALVNPIDGQSYLAKMRQGYDGFWLFRLPFTAQDEPDAFLFTYHLALGHLARLTGLSLTALYHAARILGGWGLLLISYRVIARVFDTRAERRRAWLFVAATSGLGWIGVTSTDLNIPESNTFFSILANAHFAVALALMLIVFMAVLDGSRLAAALASIGLAIIQPFAPIAVFAALGVYLLLVARRRQLIAALVAGLSLTPLMLYFYLITQRDPILQSWSAQNLTPSPSPLEYVIGYGLLGLLAIPGARTAWRRGRDSDRLLVAWAVTSAFLLYLPFPLQRRFSLGLHIPIVLLGVTGLMQNLVPALRGRLARWIPRLVFALALPSTLMLLLATSGAALRPPDPRLFVSADEAAAFDWLRANVPHDSVVLAAPATGLFLPAWADTRVLYGHPFETVEAERMRRVVEDFFEESSTRPAVISDYGVDYIFFGPQERRLGAPESDWPVAFSVGDVTLYRVP
ncbi:MAG TPA: hypothetical protein VJG32_20120 [Anaerolineae bacterium]|nr:hypothetical protein [Anaerolineae bacterium]